MGVFGVSTWAHARQSRLKRRFWSWSTAGRWRCLMRPRSRMPTRCWRSKVKWRFASHQPLRKCSLFQLIDGCSSSLCPSGIIKQDPDLPADKLLNLPPPRPKNAIFEDEEKSKVSRCLFLGQASDCDWIRFVSFSSGASMLTVFVFVCVWLNAPSHVTCRPVRCCPACWTARTQRIWKLPTSWSRKWFRR